MRTVTVLLLCLFIAGCETVYSKSVDVIAGDEATRIAGAMLQAIQASDFSTAQRLLADGYSVVPDSTWLQIRQPLIGADLDEAYATGFNFFWMSGARTTTLKYEGLAGSRWFRATIQIRADRVARIEVWPAEKSLAAENAIQWTLVLGGGLGFIVLGLIGLLASVWVCVATWRSSMPRRKRWALLSLVGVTNLSVNLTTGLVGFGLISVTVPVLSAMAESPYMPWSLKMAFPLGAVITGIKLARYNRRAAP